MNIVTAIHEHYSYLHFPYLTVAAMWSSPYIYMYTMYTFLKSLVMMTLHPTLGLVFGSVRLQEDVDQLRVQLNACQSGTVSIYL